MNRRWRNREAERIEQVSGHPRGFSRARRAENFRLKTMASRCARTHSLIKRVSEKSDAFAAASLGSHRHEYGRAYAGNLARTRRVHSNFQRELDVRSSISALASFRSVASKPSMA